MRLKLLSILLLGAAFQAQEMHALPTWKMSAAHSFYTAHKNTMRGALCFTAFAAALSYLYYNQAYFFGNDKTSNDVKPMAACSISSAPKRSIAPVKSSSSQNSIIVNATPAQYEGYKKSGKPFVVIYSLKGCKPCNALKAWIKKADFDGMTFLCVTGKKGYFPRMVGYKNGKQQWNRNGYLSEHQTSIKKLINSLKK